MYAYNYCYCLEMENVNVYREKDSVEHFVSENVEVIEKASEGDDHKQNCYEP